MSSTNMSETLNSRSFVYRKTEALAASKDDAKQCAEVSGLIDLSVVPRIGFRGINAQAHLNSVSLPTPDQPNMAKLGEGSGAKAVTGLRLSDNEYWVLDSLSDTGTKLNEVMEKSEPDNCYRLYCQNSHAWLMLTGKHIEQTMAKICGVDLREAAFPINSIAQTSVARVNAVIVRQEVNGIPAFSILSDGTSAEYLWDALLDAMSEFGGRGLSIDALGIN